MIKKTTKVIFEDDKSQSSNELVGGMPLSKGDIVHMHRGKKIIDYIVIDKIVDCYMREENQQVNITYKLKKNR